MEEISKKDRMKIPRQVMPEQDPMVRNKNFGEVNLGFTEELAKMEAMRCLRCELETQDGQKFLEKIKELAL